METSKVTCILCTSITYTATAIIYAYDVGLLGAILTTMSQFPDYYKLLNIPRTATQDEVRQAYKKESLRL